MAPTDLQNKYLQDRMDKIEAKVDKVLEKLDALPEVYVTRREYEVAKEASRGNNSIWQMVISMAVSIGAFLIAMLKMK